MLSGERSRRWFAYLLLVVAAAGTGVPILFDREGMAILSLYASIPAAVASTLYFGFAPSTFRTPFDSTAGSSGPVRLKAWVVVYLLVQAVSILLLATNDVRPLLYYGVVAVLGTVLFVQIITLELTTLGVTAILVETMGLLGNVVWSVTLKYHYFFGRTDVFSHAALATSLLENHHVTAAFGDYQPFPLWHILTAIESAMLGGALEPRVVMFVTNGIAFMLLIPVIYLVARRLGFSTELSLLAALFTCLNPFVIFNGMYSIPRNVAALTFATSLLVIGRNRRAFDAVFLLFVVGIVVYHTISTPFILVILATFYVAERVTGFRSTDGYLVSVPALVTIVVVQFGYWLVAAPGLVREVMGLVTDVLETEPGTTSTTARSVFTMPVPEVINYLQYSFLIAFVLYGVLRGVDVIRTSNAGRAALLTALAMCALSFPGPLLVLNDLMTINIYRFGQYSFPFIGIGVAVGVVALVRTDFGLDGRAARALVLLLVLSTAFLSVSNDFVASDNPVVERQFYTYYFTEPEMTSMDTVRDLSSTYVTVDFAACRYFSTLDGSSCHITQVNPAWRDPFLDDGGLLLVRRGELEKRPLQLYETTSFVADPNLYGGNDGTLRYFYRASPIWDRLRATHSRVYDSGVVTAYESS